MLLFQFFATLSSYFTSFMYFPNKKLEILRRYQQFCNTEFERGNFSFFSSPSSFSFFPLPFSPHYYVFFLSPGPARGLFYRGLRLAYDYYYPPARLIIFIILFITEYCTDFYSFVLRSSLLISYLSHFLPVLYSIIGSWCLPAQHMVLWDTAGLRNDSRSKAHMFLFISSVIQLLRVVA